MYIIRLPVSQIEQTTTNKQIIFPKRDRHYLVNTELFSVNNK